MAIETKQLTVAYGLQSALRSVDVNIPRFSMSGIIGPNGAGKSTLLKAILGMVPCPSGHVIFHQGDASSVAYVPQRNSVDWDFPASVFDVVMMGTYGRLRWFQRPEKKEKKETMEALAKVQMEDFANRQIGELSGGQQQRVFLARAFVQQASIYLMDEPFAAVDAITEKLIIELLHKVRGEGNTIVLVHHDLTTAKHYFDHIILLNKDVIACGPTDESLTSANIQSAYGVFTDINFGSTP
ncbi:MAG: metal ABC transporter ATP-binding protein [Endozoicomonas sp. (ex Botrylloides leachii)]|nr:metal ABC transporter ATP-binding protein [Endozoicomonas sp. (ex Botrylloides leachii)]